jgi:F0F1-type ATP synthase assembly protein I
VPAGRFPVTDPTDRKDPAGDKTEEEGLSSSAKAYRASDRILSASFALVAAVGVFTYLGYLLDRKLGNQGPWFTIAGALLGMTGGFIGFFRTVLDIKKK